MKLRKIVLIAAAMCAFSICANAAEGISTEGVYVRNTNDGINVWINGNEVEFKEAKPFIDENGRTQVPVREFSETFGFKVDWIPETRQVKINGDYLTLTIDSKEYTAAPDNPTSSGIEKGTTDTYPVIINDRTYVPLRFISERLGLDVVYADDTTTEGSLEQELTFDENGNPILPEGWLTEEEMQDKFGFISINFGDVAVTPNHDTEAEKEVIRRRFGEYEERIGREAALERFERALGKEYMEELLK